MENDNLHESWGTLKIVNSEEEAAVLVGFLRSNGISAAVESLHASEFPTDVGRLAEVRIRVPADQLVEAASIIEDRERAVAEGSDFPTTLVEE